MAGIQHLYDIYKKDPKFVENLLDTSIEVEEKLDGSRFGFEVKDGGDLKFFKRNDSAPITKIDRTLARYYEKAIGHFESFTPEKLSQIPDGWRFGFEYFPNLTPVKIAYDRMPLNHLVLTDITVRDPQGKVLEVITDQETLDRWAQTLECEGPPLIFKGKLDTKQKDVILKFLSTDFKELMAKFKTESFTEFLIKTLNPSAGNSFMQNSLDKDIEALVFKFDGKNPLKVMNPVYKLQKEESENQVEKPSDIYSLTLAFLQEFFQELDFKKIKLKGKKFEERYIEFICKAFNIFCKSRFYKQNFEGDIDFDLPLFLTREEAKLNYKFVTNEETLELLKVSSTNRELFKIMLASMRSHKKKPFGFFKKELLWHHNQLVDKIADYVDSGVSESFLSYTEFREVFLVNENVENWEEWGVNNVSEVTDEEFPALTETIQIDTEEPLILTEAGLPTYLEVAKTKRPYLTVLSNLAKGETSEPQEGLKSTSLVICKTTPFHSGILTALKDAKDITGKKSILCMVGHPFTDMESFRNMTAEFINAHKDLLHTVSIVKYPQHNDVLALAKSKKLKIDHLYCNKDHCNDYKIQTGHIDVHHTHSNDNLEENDIMGCIKHGDIAKYRKICLPLTHNYFYKLKNDLP
jgi:hypothetical protein